MAKRTVNDATKMAIQAQTRIPSISTYDTQITNLDVRDAFEGVHFGAAPDDSGQQYPSPTITRPPPGHIDVEGFHFPIEQYLGKGWVEEFIIPLDKIEPMAVPNSMRMVPYPWQLSGAAKINHLCRSSFGGGICGDPPGMGKTALAILAMELGAKENGSFSLVVCPSSCKMQWETEILSAYHEGHHPRVLVLEDNAKTVHELINECWDVLIVSYQFVVSQHRAK